MYTWWMIYVKINNSYDSHVSILRMVNYLQTTSSKRKLNKTQTLPLSVHPDTGTGTKYPASLGPEWPAFLYFPVFWIQPQYKHEI